MPTIKSLIADNKFDYCNSDITNANFPVIDDVDISTVKPIKMKKSFTREGAIAHLKTLGMKPVSVATGLKWVKENPEYQREHYLVCLAQSWFNSAGFECVVCFSGNASDRNAYLDDVAYRWNASLEVLAEQELTLAPSVTGTGARNLGHCPKCNETITPEMVVELYEYYKSLFVK